MTSFTPAPCLLTPAISSEPLSAGAGCDPWAPVWQNMLLIKIMSSSSTASQEKKKNHLLSTVPINGDIPRDLEGEEPPGPCCSTVAVFLARPPGRSLSLPTSGSIWELG